LLVELMVNQLVLVIALFARMLLGMDAPAQCVEASGVIQRVNACFDGAFEKAFEKECMHPRCVEQVNGMLQGRKVTFQDPAIKRLLNTLECPYKVAYLVSIMDLGDPQMLAFLLEKLRIGENASRFCYSAISGTRIPHPWTEYAAYFDYQTLKAIYYLLPSLRDKPSCFLDVQLNSLQIASSVKPSRFPISPNTRDRIYANVALLTIFGARVWELQPEDRGPSFFNWVDAVKGAKERMAVAYVRLLTARANGGSILAAIPCDVFGVIKSLLTIGHLLLEVESLRQPFIEANFGKQA